MWIEYVESLSEEDLLGNFAFVDGRGNSHVAQRALILHHAFNQ